MGGVGLGMEMHGVVCVGVCGDGWGDVCGDGCMGVGRVVWVWVTPCSTLPLLLPPLRVVTILITIAIVVVVVVVVILVVFVV